MEGKSGTCEVHHSRYLCVQRNTKSKKQALDSLTMKVVSMRFVLTPMCFRVMCKRVIFLATKRAQRIVEAEGRDDAGRGPGVYVSMNFDFALSSSNLRYTQSPRGALGLLSSSSCAHGKINQDLEHNWFCASIVKHRVNTFCGNNA